MDAMETEMSEELDEDVLELDDQDLEMIEELDNTPITEDEIEHDSEPESDPVETESEEVSSDEVDSTSNESPEPTFNPDLVSRAQQYGLNPAGFADEQALNYVVQQFDQGNDQLFQWQQWYQGQLQQNGSQQAEPSRNQRPQFTVNLSEDYDEGLRGAIDQMAAQMQAHYDQQLDYIAQSVLDQQQKLNSHQYYVSQAAQYEEQQVAVSQLDQFNSAVQRLDNADLFGDKPYQELTSGSPEASNMEKLFDQVAILQRGYQASGVQVPEQSELVEQAFATVFANQIKEQARKDRNARAVRNSNRRLGGGKSTSVANPSDDPLDDVINDPDLSAMWESMQGS